MGINRFTADWIQELESSFGILRNSVSIADLGPQDLSSDVIERTSEPGGIKIKNLEISMRLGALQTIFHLIFLTAELNKSTSIRLSIQIERGTYSQILGHQNIFLINTHS